MMALEYLQRDKVNLDHLHARGDFTILIPSHNEAAKISTTLNVLVSYLKTLSRHGSILFVENGSRDATLEKLESAAKTFENISYIAFPKASLGGALRAGVKYASGENIVYLPIDLSVDLDFVPQALRLLQENDIVIGSKRKNGAEDRRPLARRLLSVSYHSLTRLLFGIDVTDTTCVKAFRRSSVLPLLSRIRFNSIFETELVVRAEKACMKIAELPVVVHDGRLPKENLLKKVLRKLTGIVALRLLLSSEGGMGKR
jgi:glycosyltransferase involved in cell wall biosynthesis